jgi:hypothetical protein
VEEREEKDRRGEREDDGDVAPTWAKPGRCTALGLNHRPHHLISQNQTGENASSDYKL